MLKLFWILDPQRVRRICCRWRPFCSWAATEDLRRNHMQHGWVYKHIQVIKFTIVCLCQPNPFFLFLKLQEPHLFLFAKKTIQQTKQKRKKQKKKNSTSIFVWGKIRWTGQEKQTASENKRKKTKLPFLFGEQPGATSICLGIIKWKQRKHLHFCLGESPGEVLSSWSKLDFPSLAFELLKLFVQDELSSDELWDPRRLVWWPWTHDGSVELIDIHIYIYIYILLWLLLL